MRKKTLGEMPSAEQLEAELKREKYKTPVPIPSSAARFIP